MKAWGKKKKMTRFTNFLALSPRWGIFPLR